MKDFKMLYISTTNLLKKNGGGIATLNFLKILNYNYGAKNIDVIAPAIRSVNYDNDISNNISLVPERTLLRKIKGFFKRHIELTRYPSFFETFEWNKYDLIIFNGGIYSGDLIIRYTRNLPKTIVIHHNFEREYHNFNKSIFNLYGITNYLIKAREKSSYLNSDLNLFLTVPDKILFENFYGTKSNNHVFNCLLSNNESNSIIEFSKGLKLVITGSLDHPQNIDGIIDFFHNYYALVLSIEKNAEFIITGRNPCKSIIKLTEIFSNVTIIKNPDNINEIVSICDVYICPVRAGGGLKIKIQDALINGLPVISHCNSARGYEFFFDKDYFETYSNKLEFKEALQNILDYKKIKTKANIFNDFTKIFSLNKRCRELKNIFNGI